MYIKKVSNLFVYLKYIFIFVYIKAKSYESK